MSADPGHASYGQGSIVVDMMARVALPYADQAELVEDQINAIRWRIEAVLEQPERAVDARRIDMLVNSRCERSDHAQVPIMRLVSSFELSPSEAAIVWLLVAHEVSPEIRRLVRRVNSEAVADPTTDTIRRVVYGARAIGESAWCDLAEDGSLRRLGLIERTDDQARTPLHRQTWKVSARVLALAHGDLRFARELASVASIPPLSTPLHELELGEGVAAKLAASCLREGVVVAHGSAGSGRRSALLATLAANGRRALQIDGRRISKDRDMAARELRGLSRECILLGLVPLIQHFDALGAAGEIVDRLDLVESEFRGLIVATSNGVVPRAWGRAATMVEVTPLSGAQLRSLWTRALGVGSTIDPDVLATAYPLAPSIIHAAGAQLREVVGDVSADHVSEIVRGLLDNRLGGLARRIVTSQTWEDVVLPADQIASLVELMSRIQSRRRVYEEWGFGAKVGRGLGVAALFSGPPGTGKTMTAGLVARDLGLEMYQVDLSKIVSKWIGETEKNLATLFDAAEAGHAILLFDEADALFGKRTDVKSSNDRHANQEVNYLLQRLESFSGIVILTTNHASAMDEAFRRRLSVHIRFPVPEVDERLQLWRALLPKAAPVGQDLGLDVLAERFEMSGGYIRNAVVRAAFLAAADTSIIEASHLRHAAQLEYEALGKITPRI